MGFMFSIVQTEAQPTLAVRTVTSINNLPNEIGKAYGSIIAYLSGRKEQPLGPAYVAYFNMDMQNLTVEIGFPVEKETEGSGNISASQIPAGKIATCFYKGPHSGIGSTYDKLAKWVAEKGYETTGTAYEFYYNSPQEVAETELLTQIAFLLK
jgi:effector-binding domain-containing protein